MYIIYQQKEVCLCFYFYSYWKYNIIILDIELYEINLDSLKGCYFGSLLMKQYDYSSLDQQIKDIHIGCHDGNVELGSIEKEEWCNNTFYQVCIFFFYLYFYLIYYLMLC